MIRVLVVDHHTLLRHGVKLILQSAPDIEIVGQSATSDEALNCAVDLRPDVVLMESRLPDGRGFAVITAIKERCPETRILVLTSECDPEALWHAAAAGANGYILKDITPEFLVDALRAACNGRTVLSPKVAQGQPSHRGATMEENEDHADWKRASQLNRHDIEVLSLVARGLSDKEIAAQLFLSESAVKSRLRHVYQRLGLKNRAQAAVFVVEGGFLPHVYRDKSDAALLNLDAAGSIPDVYTRVTRSR